jgi:phosphohistidine phosphatase SixA
MTLVGHLPSLEYLVAALLGGDAPVKVRLRKAGVCAIDFDTSPAAGAGRLEWLLQPRQLRLLGKNGTSA